MGASLSRSHHTKLPLSHLPMGHVSLNTNLKQNSPQGHISLILTSGPPRSPGSGALPTTSQHGEASVKISVNENIATGNYGNA